MCPKKCTETIFIFLFHYHPLRHSSSCEHLRSFYPLHCIRVLMLMSEMLLLEQEKLPVQSRAEGRHLCPRSWASCDWLLSVWLPSHWTSGRGWSDLGMVNAGGRLSVSGLYRSLEVPHPCVAAAALLQWHTTVRAQIEKKLLKRIIVQPHHPSHMKQPVNVGLRDLPELLRQSGLHHVPFDPIVLREQVIQQPAVLQEETSNKQFKQSLRQEMCSFAFSQRGLETGCLLICLVHKHWN